MYKTYDVIGSVNGDAVNYSGLPYASASSIFDFLIVTMRAGEVELRDDRGVRVQYSFVMPVEDRVKC